MLRAARLALLLLLSLPARAEEVPVSGFVTLANLWDAQRGR